MHIRPVGRIGLPSALLAALAVLPVGCDRTESQPSGQTRPAGLRVISLAPHLTEIVFALGQGDRLVGVTSFCVYPPQAAKLPKCGGYMDTDLEKVLTLRPDLILIHGEHELARRFCRENKIRMVATSANDVATLYDTISAIGRALGCIERAGALVAKMKSDLGRVRSAVKSRPATKVFVSMSRQPGRIKSLYTTNGAGFVSQMLEAAGGENIFAKTDVRYPKIAPAELLGRKPEVIIELQPEREFTGQKRREMMDNWAELGPIPAVTEKRIYLITDSFAMIPGPRVPLLAKRFVELLHPDLKGKLE